MEPILEGRRKRGKFTVLGVFSVIAGIAVLGENYGYFPAVHRLWPLATAALGYGFLLLHRRGRTDMVLVGTGVYLLFFSGLALFLNYTSWWELSWLWPIFVGFLGVSILGVYFAGYQDVLYLAFGLAFVSLCLAFFFVFSVDPDLWPISLVLFGMTILLVNYFGGDR